MVEVLTQNCLSESGSLKSHEDNLIKLNRKFWTGLKNNIEGFQAALKQESNHTSESRVVSVCSLQSQYSVCEIHSLLFQALILGYIQQRSVE